MKQILLLLLFIVALAGGVTAQVSTPQGSIPKVIVANLPSPGQSNQLWEVTDSLAGSCTVGGSTTSAFCRWNGSAYAAVGSSGTVTTTGSPVSGNLAKFSGATSLTNGNLSGDVTTTDTLATTLASVISAGGPIGSATVAPIITYDAKGRLTTVSSATIAPAVGSVTGLGTGVATALGVNIGSAGAVVVNGGALGSPSSAGTLPAFTLGGTVSGGGNQINNVIIGTVTPLAGSFTTVTASTSLTSPIHAASADGTTAIKFTKADGSTVVGVWDTTNTRLRIGSGTAPTAVLDVTGAALFSSTLGVSGTSTLDVVTQTPAARSSGVAPYFTINIPADTAQTAATESPGFKTVTATRTWATTGTVALQRENYFAGPTYASASASQTFTDAFTLYIDKPIQGTNAIFTRAHSVGIVDSTSAGSSVTGGLVVATTLGTTATSVGIGGGNINAGGSITAAGALAGGSVSVSGAAQATKLISVSSFGTYDFSSNGVFKLTDFAGTSFGRLQFGGATNSTAAIGFDVVNGFTLQSAAGTATWNDASTAGSGTVTNRYLFGIAAPTLTATNSSVTNTVASTVYIGGAPTDSTNTTSTTKWALLVAAGGTKMGGTVFVPSLTTSSGVQTAVLCQASTGEMIADSVACLASSGRFKESIIPLRAGLGEILALRPVSFFYKPEGIFAKNPSFQRERVGLIAEDVAKIDTRLVGYEADGVTPRTVGYEQVVPVLINAVQELNTKLDAQAKTIASLTSSMFQGIPVFRKGIVTSLTQVRDTSGTVTAISFTVLMIDSNPPGESRSMSYTLTAAEFVALPGGAAAKKAQLVALIKREVHKSFNQWQSEVTIKPQAPIGRDPNTDLGITEITDFVGEAP